MNTGSPPPFADSIAIVTGTGSGMAGPRPSSSPSRGPASSAWGAGRKRWRRRPRAHSAIAALPLDICGEGAADMVVGTAVARRGRPDPLVNNAGAAAPMPPAEADRAAITGLFELNVTAPSLLASAALPRLTKVLTADGGLELA
ncbi:SDR family NAD(P)-dependent oxidoreductase [Streptomyces spinosirectus]